MRAYLRSAAELEKANLQMMFQKQEKPIKEDLDISKTSLGTKPTDNTYGSPLDQNFRVSQEYGNYNPRLYAGVTKDSRHHGLDIATPEGTPIKSPFAGIVKTGESKDFGKFVEIRTQDGQIMRFSHLRNIEDLAVQLGAASREIQAGQTLGYTGNTGRSTAPHLDIMYQKGGQWTDPLQFDPLRRTLGR
jgi:murein DD-endopeptidase MepM/ murein hydrolase activator NlpD